jgi:hypothetical protein
MTMLTVRLYDNTYDAVHKVSAQVPVGAEIVAGNLLTDPPTSTTTAGKPGVTFRVPTGATESETRNFIFVKDGEPVGDADHYHLIGSYFSDLYVEHARHLFEVTEPANS